MKLDENLVFKFYVSDTIVELRHDIQNFGTPRQTTGLGIKLDKYRALTGYCQHWVLTVDKVIDNSIVDK